MTKAEISSLYFATHDMKCPRGWSRPFPVGRYWRCAIVVFFNYGVDTGTVWKTASFHEPILWRHVSWDRQSPDRDAKEQSPWGWLFYRRIKTDKAFYRPMNRTVHAHIKSIMPEHPDPDAPVFWAEELGQTIDSESYATSPGSNRRRASRQGKNNLGCSKTLRKTCATYYDEHLPESSVEILGHSVGGVTYRHYAHRAPLAFKAIMTLPQPSAFSALAKGFDGACPCCRRQFTDAQRK